MLTLIQKHKIWEYLSLTQKDLILEGKYLVDIIKPHRFKDYSFMVFPFAKAYEGYLKQLFLDVGFITHESYISDHFRVGKYLSPHMIEKLNGESVYVQISEKISPDLAHDIWNVWKKGRNQVIHYYPHNFKRLSYNDSVSMIEDILRIMILSYQNIKK